MAEAPDYHLHHVEDGCDGQVEIMPVTHVEADTPLARREAFRAGLTVAAFMGLLAACSTGGS